MKLPDLKIWKSKRATPATSSWWTDADAAAAAPSDDLVAALRTAALAFTDPDDRERAEEMIAGLEQLRALAAAQALPVLASQHRVIGADVCHFSAPANLVADVESPGRVFVTNARLLFAGPSVKSWPWHRVARLVRSARTVSVVTAGGDPAALMCNSYGDAMMIAALAARLRR